MKLFSVSILFIMCSFLLSEEGSDKTSNNDDKSKESTSVEESQWLRNLVDSRVLREFDGAVIEEVYIDVLGVSIITNRGQIDINNPDLVEPYLYNDSDDASPSTSSIEVDKLRPAAIKSNSLGFDFHTYDPIGISDIYNGLNQPSYMQNGFYFSVMMDQGIKIESYIAHNKSKYEKDYKEYGNIDSDESIALTQVTVGLFLNLNVPSSSNIQPYIGARFGKCWYEYENSLSTDVEDELTIFSPSIGVEYYLGKNKEISFGAEVSARLITQSYEYDDPTTYTMENDYDENSSQLVTVPKFIIRYHF